MSTAKIKTRVLSLSPSELTAIVLFAFVLALALRMLGLARAPMSADEAVYALRAFDLVQSQPIMPLENASYLALTSLSFFLTQASTFMARFWPALIGSSLALLPLLWRKRFSNLAVIIAALLLAVDPSLVQISRQADSAIIAVASVAWTLTFLLQSKPILTGLCLALSLLGGPWVWVSVLALALTWLVARLMKIGFNDYLSAAGLYQVFTERALRRPFLLSFSIALLLLATAFLRYPAGLSGIMTGLVGLLSARPAELGISAWLPLYQLFARSLYLLLLALLAIIPAWRQKQSGAQLLSVLAGFGILLSFIFTGQAVGGLALASIPLILLAARALERLLSQPIEANPQALGYMVFSLAVLVYISLSLPRLFVTAATDPFFVRYALTVLAGLILLGLTYFLVGMGWSYQTARQGLITALLLVFMAGMLSHSLAGLSSQPEREAMLWATSPSLVLEEDLTPTLTEVATQSELVLPNASAVLLGDDFGAYRWALRDFGSVRQQGGISKAIRPELVLAASDMSLEVGDVYRGREVLATRQIDWQAMTLAELSRSLFTGTPLTKSGTITLWIRAGLFTGVSP